MAPRQPSQVSIGKKPMAYPPATNNTNATPATNGQGGGKSARAAAKAPASYAQGGGNGNGKGKQTAPPSAPTTAPASSAKGKAQQTPPQPSTTTSNSKIWSTSSTEERERIKEFWLNLSVEERRNLVKVEKDTVLRKMKEQQRHSCSCAVCGRKRCVATNFSEYLLLLTIALRFLVHFLL